MLHIKKVGVHFQAVHALGVTRRPIPQDRRGQSYPVLDICSGFKAIINRWPVSGTLSLTCNSTYSSVARTRITPSAPFHSIALTL